MPAQPVRIASVGAYMGVVPVVPGHYIDVAAVVPEPGAVQGSGQAVVLPGSAGAAGGPDAPFRQHSVHRFGVGHFVIPQLEIVVPDVQAIRFPFIFHTSFQDIKKEAAPGFLGKKSKWIAGMDRLLFALHSSLFPHFTVQ